MLKKWGIIVPIKEARGHQYYEVDAESIEEARQLWVVGDELVRFVSDEIEVTSLGEPEIKEAE